MEGNDSKKDKFGLSKLRSLFIGSSEQNLRRVSGETSCSQISGSRHVRHSSSVPIRENYVPDAYKKNSMHGNAHSHPSLAHSKSLPVHTQTQASNDNKRQRLCRTGGEVLVRRHDEELRRKATVWRNDLVAVQRNKEDSNFKLRRNFPFDDQLSLKSELSNPEDHIYEEIDSDIFTSCDEEEVSENFLLGISLERRNHLKFYGSAGWDFGNQT